MCKKNLRLGLRRNYINEFDTHRTIDRGFALARPVRYQNAGGFGYLLRWDLFTRLIEGAK